MSTLEPIAVWTIPSAEELHEYLHHINEQGDSTNTGGVDANGNPFVVHLLGASVAVLTNSPWDGEVDFGTGMFCEECNAASLPTLASLAYPVRVIAKSP